jgi:hypothetical protein
MRTVLHRLPVRHRMMSVWTDPKGRSYRACLKHGAVGQQLDGAQYYAPTPCPICCAEVGAQIDAQKERLA